MILFAETQFHQCPINPVSWWKHPVANPVDWEGSCCLPSFLLNWPGQNSVLNLCSFKGCRDRSHIFWQRAEQGWKSISFYISATESFEIRWAGQPLRKYSLVFNPVLILSLLFKDSLQNSLFTFFVFHFISITFWASYCSLSFSLNLHPVTLQRTFSKV